MEYINKKLRISQVVRFINYKRNTTENEAYFIVIQEEDPTKEIVLFTLNSNRIYSSKTTIIPEFPQEDLELISLQPSELIFQEITIKEMIFNHVVTGKAVNFIGNNDIIQFKQIGNALVSDTIFELSSTSEQHRMGPLYIDLNYETEYQ